MWPRAASCESGQRGSEAVLPRKKATILCIDDHQNALIGRKLLLEEKGYRVLDATDGRKGLALFRSHRVNAVILDYQMPGMNGDALAAEMKQSKSAVPIMMLSAYGVPESQLRSVDTYVSKSEPPEVFLSQVENLLHGRTQLFFSHWIEDWKSRIGQTLGHQRHN
jgi:two-component system, OmpR family, response regulator CpxR